MGTHIKLTAGDGHKFGAYRVDPAGTPKGGIVVDHAAFGIDSAGPARSHWRARLGVPRPNHGLATRGHLVGIANAFVRCWVTLGFCAFRELVAVCIFSRTTVSNSDSFWK